MWHWWFRAHCWCRPRKCCLWRNRLVQTDRASKRRTKTSVAPIWTANRRCSTPGWTATPATDSRRAGRERWNRERRRHLGAAQPTKSSCTQEGCWNARCMHEWWGRPWLMGKKKLFKKTDAQQLFHFMLTCEWPIKLNPPASFGSLCTCLANSATCSFMSIKRESSRPLPISTLCT